MERVYLYANLVEEELSTIDEISKKLGYPSRTEMLTDLLRSLVYGKTFRNETEELNALLTLAPEIDRLKDTFMEILDDYAFPVIAMRGADTAYTALKDDLKI